MSITESRAAINKSKIPVSARAVEGCRTKETGESSDLDVFQCSSSM